MGEGSARDPPSQGSPANSCSSQCISHKTRQMKITSSLQMPDRVLNYLKDHFLMNSAVRSQALLVQPRSRYRQLSVQRVQSLQQTYDVLFLGTGEPDWQKGGEESQTPLFCCRCCLGFVTASD